MLAITRLGDYSAGHCFNPRGNNEASDNFFVNGLGVHRVGDGWPSHCCGNVCHSSTTSVGSPRFFVNNRPASRIGSDLDCGDVVAQGSPDFYID